MSTRQYIGARYVPQFYEGADGSTEWVYNVPYEALTMVTHLGNTYTSKKPVPVGVNINDTNYWVVTGNYNAQVEQYRQETEEVSKAVSKLFSKRYLLIGDSIGEGVGLTIGGWCASFKRIFNLTDDECYISAEGGAGFCSKSNNNKDFIDLLSSTISDRDSISDIVLYGGVNDCSYSYEAIRTQVISFCNTAKVLYPNANIHIGFEGWFVGDWYSGLKFTTTNMNKVFNAIKSGISSVTNIHYLKNTEYIMHNPEYFQGDGLHATQEATDKMACDIMLALNNSLDVKYDYINANFTPTEGTVSHGAIRTAMNNNNTLVDVQTGILFSSPVNHTFDINFWEIGTIKNSFYLGNTSGFEGGIINNNSMLVKLLVKDSSNKFYDIIGYLIIAQNKLFLYAEALSDDGVGYLNTNVTEVKITGFNVMDSMIQ